MKHFIKTSVAALMMAASCGPVYYRQVTTLSSEDVKFNEKGEYVYENDLVCIEYNFWKENGSVDFVVTNNTDDAIYLDLSQSFFIRNGYAYDYFKNRTWQASKGVELTSAQCSSFSEVRKDVLVPSYGNTNGFSLEYKEMPVVCIPAHSSKNFGEYIVSSQVYRECDFNRKPRSGEESVREFTQETSPLVIENRLMFILGDVHIPVTNMFYASKFQNIAQGDESHYETIKYCNGYTGYLCVHKLYGVNKFYINYNDYDISSLSGPVMDKKRNDSPETGYIRSR